MDNIVEARKNMHERQDKEKKNGKSKGKKIKNFFFGCCKNK